MKLLHYYYIFGRVTCIFPCILKHYFTSARKIFRINFKLKVV